VPADRRPLSGLERVWLTAERLQPPFAFQWVLEGQGALPPDRVRDALATLAVRLPSLRARLRGVLRGAHWRFDGPLPLVEVWDAPRWDGIGSPGAGRLEAPMRHPVEVLLGDGRVVVRVRHALMDGIGSLLLLGGLFSVLRGELPPAEDSVVDLDLVEGIEVDAAPPPPRDALPPLRPTDVHVEGRRWARRSYEGPTSSLLPRTLHALAGIARQDHGQPDGVVRLEAPVDLRRYRPELRATANLTALLRLQLDPACDQQRVRQQLRDALEGHEHVASVRTADLTRGLPLWLLSFIGGWQAGIGHRTGRFSTTGTVSTLGRVDLDPLSCPGWRTTGLFVIPPANPDLPLLMTMVGGPAGVELCATMPGWLGGEEGPGRLLDELVRRLGRG